RQRSAGVQRRRFRLRAAREQSGPAATVQGDLSTTGAPSSRYGFFFLSAWRSVAARLSERPERLPEHSAELLDPGWCLLDRREPTEPCGGPGGYPMNRTILVRAIVCLALGPMLAACGTKTNEDLAAEASSPTVERAPDSSMAKVDHP